MDTNTSNSETLVTDDVSSTSSGRSLRLSTTEKVNFLLISLVITAFFVVVLVVVLMIVFGASPQTENGEIPPDQPVVGLALANTRTERWQRDRELIINGVEDRGGAVYVTNANDDAEVQIDQVESLLLREIDVLIVVVVDSESEAVIVDMAHENGVSVIAYDRMIVNSDLDYYVSFNNVEVGEIQAQGVLAEVSSGKFAYIGGSETDNNAHLVKEGTMNVLQPYLDDGRIELVLEEFTPDWKQEEAYKTVHDYLSSGGELDAVIAANDGTASGTINALDEFGLAGRVPVSGQDAELTACQRIVDGEQTVTVYKPLDRLAAASVELAFNIINQTPPELADTINNGQKDVPAVLVGVEKVTRANMQEVIIDSGFHSYEEVYQD